MLLITTLNNCISKFVFSDGPGTFYADISEGTQSAYRKNHPDLSLNSPVAIRKHFYDTYFFNLDNIKDVEDIKRVALLSTIKQAMLTRVESFLILKSNSSIPSSQTEEALIKLEKTYLSEEYGWEFEARDIEQSTGLREFIDKAINKDQMSPGAASYAIMNLVEKAFGETDVTKLSDRQQRYFFAVFKDSSIEKASQLSGATFRALINKLEQSGLLKLASHAGSIQQFARERLSSVEQLKRSARESLDPVRDTAWLTQLNYAIQNVSRDPITLGILNVYFPSLISFFFESIAVASDYSNNGKGGGSEDTINSLDDFLDSLEKAFGRTTDFNGEKIKESVFQLAARYENTAKKMKAALDASPYRSNNAPESPDIFHLRLGASNFFVPPLTIDVNTYFKSGSLTGGALRQKSSPKFNSGFKETSIRMKLFFPNYEEIWGISIDDASKISLNDNYQIDFNTDGSSDKKIDKFLSSLRGLVAAFKYSPFLPIRNHYLNRVHGITAVALSSMSISTIPNFPFALAVDIELLNFNHKPFLPMISDFNQAIHWGKYRQYMGKAAGSLHKYVNSSFLMKISDDKEDAGSNATSRSILKDGITADRYDREISVTSSDSFENNKLVTNIVREWIDGKNISFFVPAETQTKIFLPDTTNFRQDEEKYINDHGQDAWAGILGRFGIDLNESAGYGINLSGVYQLSRNSTVSPSIFYHLRNAIDLLTAGLSDKTYGQSLYSYNANLFALENTLSLAEANYIFDYNSVNAPATPKRDFTFQKNKLGSSDDGITIKEAKQILKTISSSVTGVLDREVEKITEEKAKKLGYQKDSKQYADLKERVRQEAKDGFNILVYNRFFQSGPIEALMEAARQKSGSFSFREWEVPMLKVDLDPAYVTVTGVSLTLGNNLAKLQLQMQDEPTYQHIGGRDTYINISMRITSEKELNKLKRIFDHVNALARLEHSTGVIGFIGIKNVITALGGVKYVIPSNYSVNTVPNYPHVYDVNISLLDFDIFQQDRERLSSKHQKQLIKEFGSKRNPFLRIKQMWGIFNAYPDLPLDVRDKENEIVGHLDPDFYFRSFEMFDKDVIYNFTRRQKELTIPKENQNIGSQTNNLLKNVVARKVIDLIQTYESNLNYSEYAGDKKQAERDLINDVVSYLESSGISYDSFLEMMKEVSGNPQLFNSSSSVNKSYNVVKRNKKLITDAIEYVGPDDVSDEEANFSNSIVSAPHQVGDLTTDNHKIMTKVKEALEGKFSLKSEDVVSFDLDDLEFMANISVVPIKDKNEPNKVPAIMSIGTQVHLGYIDNEKDGRFYLTVDGFNVKKNANAIELMGRKITDDHSDPSKVNISNSIYSLTPMSEYGKPYANDLESHWENMLVDTQYRDVSGRMIRAFPTYMLWLIDEGGNFAGVKLFDNFYGLQSIIDFSLVSSEDLVGDTLVIRLSNLYSKLSKKESSSLFNPNLDEYGDEMQQDNPGMTEGISGVIDTTLNKARNILAHMKNEYVVDVENIRIKPGIRVHLRGGYGSNPNSLHTLFNGTITEVEQGEIVTITAQSDAIELGAIVNSTNKKGDSGKIDGGINTGLWLSEPRDLMVRLLSMGTSRFRESVAYANRGLVFSENKFGIRHFGSMIYQPMSREEEVKHFARVDAIADAHKHVGERKLCSQRRRYVRCIFNWNPRAQNSNILFNESTMV